MWVNVRASYGSGTDRRINRFHAKFLVNFIYWRAFFCYSRQLIDAHTHTHFFWGARMGNVRRSKKSIKIIEQHTVCINCANIVWFVCVNLQRAKHYFLKFVTNFLWWIFIIGWMIMLAGFYFSVLVHKIFFSNNHFAAYLFHFNLVYFICVIVFILMIPFNFLRVALRWMPRCISMYLSLNNQRMFVPFSVVCYTLHSHSFPWCFICALQLGWQSSKINARMAQIWYLCERLFFERWIWQKAQTQTKYHLQIIGNKNNNSKTVISVHGINRNAAVNLTFWRSEWARKVDRMKAIEEEVVDNLEKGTNAKKKSFIHQILLCSMRVCFASRDVK